MRGRYKMQFRVFAVLDKPSHFYYFNCDEEGEPFLEQMQEREDFEKCMNGTYNVKDLGIKKMRDMDEEWLQDMNEKIWLRRN